MPVCDSNRRDPSATPPFSSAVRMISRRMSALFIEEQSCCINPRRAIGPVTAGGTPFGSTDERCLVTVVRTDGVDLASDSGVCQLMPRNDQVATWASSQIADKAGFNVNAFDHISLITWSNI